MLIRGGAKCWWQLTPRYRMFLSSLSITCKELGLSEASAEFSAALSSILSAASHTNTMMWIGKMEGCPLDLSGQGQLLKQGRVGKCEILKIRKAWGSQGNVSTGSGRRRLGGRWSISPQSYCLILFKQSLVLCRTSENLTEPDSPLLVYSKHFW